MDEQDYKVFLRYLKDALTSEDIKKIPMSLRGRTFQAIPHHHKKYESEIELVAYCLMPNHFHLLIKQSSSLSMTSFLRSVTTRYVLYFNKKYERVGPLFQGRYKAVLVEKDEYLLHLSRYIHLNPVGQYKDLSQSYSSYAGYLGTKNIAWVKPKVVSDFFDKNKSIEFRNTNSYKDFVEGKGKEDDDLLLEIEDLKID